MTWKPVIPASSSEVSTFRKQFRKKSRFLLDENLPLWIADGIRHLGWNAKTATELGRTGRSDEDLFAFAKRDNRIIVTCDRDFLDEHRFPPHRNPGVLLLHGGSGDSTALFNGLVAVLPLIGNHRELFRRTTVEVDARGIFTVTDQDWDTGARTAKRFRYSRSGHLEAWVR